MRLSAATVMTWRGYTREEQVAHNNRMKDDRERGKRARTRESTRTVTPDPETETQEEEATPMDTRMVSLLDNQDVLKEFVKELEAQKPEPAPAHLSGKPPASIAQQNDGLVVKLKRGLIEYWLKVRETITPSKRLAQAPYPQQRVLLVIINEVEDPKKGGGTVSLREVRRAKPQMIVCCDSKRGVSEIVNKLISGFSRDSIEHEKYEHIRMYGREDVERVLSTTMDRKRETLHIPTLPGTVDRFVDRGGVFA